MSKYFENKKREELTQNEKLNVTNRFLESNDEHSRRLMRHKFEFSMMLGIVKDFFEDLNSKDAVEKKITMFTLSTSGTGPAEQSIAKMLIQNHIGKYVNMRHVFEDEVSVGHDKGKMN